MRIGRFVVVRIGARDTARSSNLDPGATAIRGGKILGGDGLHGLFLDGGVSSVSTALDLGGGLFADAVWGFWLVVQSVKPDCHMTEFVVCVGKC